MNKKDVKAMLLSKKAVVTGDHFVYKKGTHGSDYIDKEAFVDLGARNLSSIIRFVGLNAIRHLDIGEEKEIGVIGPAYGAIPFALTLADFFEFFFGIKFFPARTELTDKKVHIIPEKLRSSYKKKAFIIFEDIVNNGTTTREVKALFEQQVSARIIAASCFVDRGGQTAGTLGISQYYPMLRVDMEQVDVREETCSLCEQGVPINIELGKGKRWVEMFGQPPYPKGKDFSAFWE